MIPSKAWERYSRDNHKFLSNRDLAAPILYVKFRITCCFLNVAWIAGIVNSSLPPIAGFRRPVVVDSICHSRRSRPNCVADQSSMADERSGLGVVDGHPFGIRLLDGHSLWRKMAELIEIHATDDYIVLGAGPHTDQSHSAIVRPRIMPNSIAQWLDIMDRPALASRHVG